MVNRGVSEQRLGPPNSSHTLSNLQWPTWVRTYTMKRIFSPVAIVVSLAFVFSTQLSVGQPSARIGTVVTSEAVTDLGILTTNPDANAALLQRYAVVTSPNPFVNFTAIEFTLPTPSFVTLTLNDASGSSIGTMLSDQLQAGNYSIEFDATALPVGGYTYTLEIDTMRIVGTLMRVGRMQP